MNRREAIFQQFGHRELIPLAEVAEFLFGMSPDTANRRLLEGDLTIPVIKLHNTKNAPWFVPAGELADYVDQLAAKEIKNWQAVNAK